MKVLLAHNHYQQQGGEDQVFAEEGRLLEENGHTVIRYTAHNDLVKIMGPAALARSTLWNRNAYYELRNLIRFERPQVMHCHNTFPLISPAAYYAAQSEGLPVVQTLHNYRLLCPNALFFRNGRPCEDCLGAIASWPGIFHSCYRGDRLASGIVAAMLSIHRGLGTWNRKVKIYIALTEFAKKKFIQGGIPECKIMVKPNFVAHDPGVGDGRGKYAIFVGRLSEEKGIDRLLTAWPRVGKELTLQIVGDGPLASKVANVAETEPSVVWLGHQPTSKVYDLIGSAMFLICPSEWYETFGLVVIEAFAKGTPVLTSKIGALAELVENGRTGLHFNPGDLDDMVEKIKWAISNQDQLKKMRRNARTEFEHRYTRVRNYETLMKIYRAASSRSQFPLTNTPN